MAIEFSFTDYDNTLACYCGAAITFVTDDGFILNQIDLILLDGTGTPDVTVNIDLYAVDGAHKPTGSSLYSIGTIDQDTLTGTPTWHEFTDLDYELSASTEYAIVCDVDNKDGTSNFRWGQGNASYTDGVDWNKEYFVPQGCQNWSSHINTWNFRVYSSPLPEKPITPSPTDSGTGITLDEAQLTWEDGGYTDTYNVYFGESGSEVLQSSAQVGLTWTIPFGTLDYNTTYGWRIDASNDVGTTTGDTWTFTTISFAPPVPSATNTLSIIKRLVAAAANKIWYENI